MKRRADVVGVFPKEDGIVRLVAAALLEPDDKGRLRRRHSQVEGLAELEAPPAEDPTLISSTEAA